MAPAASLHVSRGKCSCISWESAYASHNVKCGQGYELSVVEMEKLPVQMLPDKAVLSQPFDPHGTSLYDMALQAYTETCVKGFEKMSFTGCLNKKFGNSTEQWCYVSAECDGAEAIPGTDVGIHMCAEGDDFMNDTAPEELNRLAQEDSLDISLFGKLSYQIDKDFMWSGVQAASGLTENILKQTHDYESFHGIEQVVPQEVTLPAKSKLEAVKASGVATIFDTESQQGAGTLVWGTKTYAFSPLGGPKESPFFGYVCVEGCSNSIPINAAQ